MKCLWHQINNFRGEHLQSSTSLSLLSGWQSSGATNYLQSHSAKPTLILTSGSLFSHLRSAILMMVTSLFFMHQLVLFFVGEKAKYCIVIMAFCVFFVWWNCILYNFMQCVFKMLQIFIGLCSYVLTLRNKKLNLLVSGVGNKILRIVIHKYRGQKYENYEDLWHWTLHQYWHLFLSNNHLVSEDVVFVIIQCVAETNFLQSQWFYHINWKNSSPLQDLQ